MRTLQLGSWRGDGGGAGCKLSILLYITILLYIPTCYIFYTLKQQFSCQNLISINMVASQLANY